MCPNIFITICKYHYDLAEIIFFCRETLGSSVPLHEYIVNTSGVIAHESIPYTFVIQNLARQELKHV